MSLTEVVTDDEDQSRTTEWRSVSAGRTDATTPTNPPGFEETDQLSKDVIFGLLRNQRRRRVLKYLAENGPETTLSDLAEHIASLENDKPVAAIDSNERKCVYIGLYQCHLPKMDDANVIDYNQPRGTVQLRVEADQLFAYLTFERPGSNQAESWRRRLVPAQLLELWTKYGEWNPFERVRHR